MKDPSKWVVWILPATDETRELASVGVSYTFLREPFAPDRVHLANVDGGSRANNGAMHHRLCSDRQS